MFVAAAIAACALSASAGVVVTQNRAAFEAGLTNGFTVENFTSTAHFPISSGVLNSSTTEAGLVADQIKAGVTYSTTIGTGNFFNIDAGGGFDGGFLDSVTGTHLLTVTFDNAVTGFGFDTNALARNVDLTIFFDDNTSLFLHNVADQMEFFGFTADGAAKIKSAVIGSAQNGTFTFALDNFTFGNGAGGNKVPEPGSLLLAAAALGAALRFRRKV